eukprot:TRINITY_DN1446_c0_g2_i1.p1 TRINITY_DN1446_c0_g2~~TRINITY_DN1446_c0_g2_i1.p1  ORF type:complete len:724 (+),score=191.35 TRINITY_DN1446_c0_g2_i1:149-2173(+)
MGMSLKDTPTEASPLRRSPRRPQLRVPTQRRLSPCAAELAGAALDTAEVRELKAAIDLEIAACLGDDSDGSSDGGGGWGAPSESPLRSRPGSSEACLPPSAAGPNPFKLPPLPTQSTPRMRNLVALRHDPRERRRLVTEMARRRRAAGSPKGGEETPPAQRNLPASVRAGVVPLSAQAIASSFMRKHTQPLEQQTTPAMSDYSRTPKFPTSVRVVELLTQSAVADRHSVEQSVCGDVPFHREESHCPSPDSRGSRPTAFSGTAEDRDNGTSISQREPAQPTGRFRRMFKAAGRGANRTAKVRLTKVVQGIQSLGDASTDRWVEEHYGAGGRPGDDTLFGSTLAECFRRQARAAVAELRREDSRCTNFSASQRGDMSALSLPLVRRPSAAPSGRRATMRRASRLSMSGFHRPPVQLPPLVPQPPPPPQPAAPGAASGIAQAVGRLRGKPRVTTVATVVQAAHDAAAGTEEIDARQRAHDAGIRDMHKDHLTPAEFERFKNAFDEMDDDGSGEISIQELRSHGGIMFIAGRALDLRIFNQIDRDHSGTVDFLEIMRAFFPMIPRAQLDQHLAASREAEARRRSLLERQRPLEERFTPQQLEELRLMFSGFMRRARHRRAPEADATFTGLTMDDLQRALPLLPQEHITEYFAKFAPDGVLRFPAFCEMMRSEGLHEG